MNYLVLSLFAFTSLFAQDRPARILILQASDHLFIDGWALDKPCIRDTTRVKVSYDLVHLSDTVREKTCYNRMLLEVGPTYVKYYSFLRDTIDKRVDYLSNHAPMTLGSTAGYTPMDQGGEDGNINGEIWIDRPRNLLTERFHSLHNFHESIEYEEPAPTFDWQLRPDTLTVCGYLCHLAETSFRGRKWQVWYTPEIPVSAGPWKFGGLPGLILQASDTQGHYQWSCTGIETPMTPMIYYEVPARSVSHKQWLTYYRRVHESPMEMLNPEGWSFRVIVDGQDLDDSWTIPYNPIERE